MENWHHKWEYKVIQGLYLLTENQLNTLGEEGWDLVSHTIEKEEFYGRHYYIFKR